MSGFPDGCRGLERSAEWYEAQHQKPSKYYSAPARELPSAHMLWEPALDIVEGRILDIGCGQGHLAEICALREIPYVMGIDVSPTAILLARTRTASAVFELVAPSGVSRVVGETLYDTAVFLEVLEHVFEDLELIGGVPGGRRVVFSVPSFYTEGHCRWFASAGEVFERYGDLVDIDSATIRSGGSNSWFICGGTRR